MKIKYKAVEDLIMNMLSMSFENRYNSKEILLMQDKWMAKREDIVEIIDNYSEREKCSLKIFAAFYLNRSSN